MNRARPVRVAAATSVAVVVLCAVAACGTQDDPAVPHLTATPTGASSTTTTASSTTTTSSPTTTAAPTPDPIPTTFAASQSAFTLPAATDTPTVEMLRAYVLFEDAFRRSQRTTTPDPAIRTYAVGTALTAVTTTLTYLHSHGTTQQGPWRFHVTTARASGRNGVLNVCIGGGTYTEKGATTPYTSTTSIRVTLNDASGRWLVSGYDQRQEPCS